MANLAQKTTAAQQHPATTLEELAKEWGTTVEKSDFAVKMDEEDPLKTQRSKFCIPKMKDLPYTDLKLTEPDEDCIYLCGNSLGLKPCSADAKVLDAMSSWGKLGVHSHFHGALPAALCDNYAVESTARLIGAQPSEVALMNSLTVNLHFMLVTFYQPQGPGVGRHKIIIEKDTFPSDRYAVMSHLELHGQNVNDALIIVGEKGDNYIPNQKIIDTIRKHGSETALVLLSTVHYYTGQLFDMEAITKAAHEEGCYIGWDLAHAVGNVALQIHDCGPDFGVWCSYKYLNSGAGGVGGIFVHSRHLKGEGRKALRGWWSNKPETRFKMSFKLEPASGASSFKVSNPSPWHTALNLASLEIFEEATMPKILEKQRLLTGYTELLLQKHLASVNALIITPKDPNERGSQLSIRFPPGKLDPVARELDALGVVFDIRHPDVLRIAPAPLYNSYQDVWRFVRAFTTAISRCPKTILSW
ncbi:kynureninase-like isoform X1 [Ischnura elegans]|uniref:kynureninase-like isoform X1 n=1 Tax=Ischnura elegans TaxID=197161 RepID=UPI001ED88282|nr:kynureninase-like isoform X1 [Ischnura elegans]